MANENIYSTKFIMSAVCLLMVFVAFMLNKISSGEFMPFVLGILGTYTAGNVAAKFSNTGSAD